MNTPIISVLNLNKSFGSKKVLLNINLEVFEKDSLVILGQSGTGKSVLFKCMLGILKPEQGNVFIKGTKVNELSEKKRFLINKDISMVFQGSALFDSYNILDNVTFGIIAHQKIDKNKQISIATECLERVGLDSSILKLYPTEISGGMQKRVALARAIATKPKIIFFDEPTSGLDPISSNIINNLILEITKDLGVTSLTITHDIKSAKTIASNVILLHKGTIAWQGKANELSTTNNQLVYNFVNGIPS